MARFAARANALRRFSALRNEKGLCEAPQKRVLASLSSISMQYIGFTVMPCRYAASLPGFGGIPSDLFGTPPVFGGSQANLGGSQVSLD
jgi:hypothetical protein